MESIFKRPSTGIQKFIVLRHKKVDDDGKTSARSERLYHDRPSISLKLQRGDKAGYQLWNQGG